MQIFVIILLLSSTSLGFLASQRVGIDAHTSISSTQGQYIQEFNIPRNNSIPAAITVAPNGTVWFVELNAGRLAKLNPSSGNITEFPFLNSSTYTYPLYETQGTNSLASDSQGNLWFTLGHANALGRFNVTDLSFSYYNLTELSTGQPPSIPFGITVDPSGIVWVAESAAGRIGRLDPSNGSFLEYSLTLPNETPYKIFVDHNQIVWVTTFWYTATSPQESGSTLTRLDPSTGHVTSFELSAWGVLTPVGVVVDSNNRAWIGDHGGSWLVEVNTSTGAVKLHKSSLPPLVPNPNNLTDRVFGSTFSLVNDVVLGIDGTPWFIEHIGARVGHYNPSSDTMIEYNIPTPYPITLWLAADQSGGIWFTEQSGNKIGYIDTQNASPLFSVPSTTIPATLTAGGSSIINVNISNTSPSALSVTAGVENTYDYSGPLSNLTVQSGETRVVSVQITSSPYLTAGNYSTGRLSTLAPVIRVSDGSVNYPITVLAIVSGGSSFGPLLWVYAALGALVVGGTIAGGALFHNRRKKNAG